MPREISDDATYTELVAELAELRQQADHAGGAYDELLKQLKADHGIKTIEEARAEIKRLEKRARDKKAAAQEEYEAVNAELEKDDGQANDRD